MLDIIVELFGEIEPRHLTGSTAGLATFFLTYFAAHSETQEVDL
jgi:hypothetical protein